ncbi:MAG: hypothetical protein J6Y28_07285 [Acholeplasmatales bacterium]|nr:hypothetical protein [Acholeplasmatales bacterium]
MANAKCVKCTALFELKYAKTSTALLQCPKCGNKASVKACYDEYERYKKQKENDSIKKRELELKKKEEELKRKEEELKKKEETQKQVAKKVELKKDGTTQIVYKDGIYTGSVIVLNGKRVRQGKGTYKSNDGDTFKGTWENDLLEGECEQLFSDGCYNAGTFKKGKLVSGKTKRKFANGIYVGDIVNGLFDGKGKITLNTNQVYEGEFSKGKRSGEGTCSYPNGEKYKGSWLNDMREGKGTYYYAGGQREEATWHEGRQISNVPTYYYDTNGIIEERYYENGKLIKKKALNKNTARIGQVVVKTKSGLFIGDVRGGKINGVGTYYYENGDIYEGSFRDNIIDGNGVYHFGSGDKKGDRQEGSYVKNVIVGQAFYYYKDGRIESRVYNPQGKLIGKKLLNVNTIEPDQRVVTFSNGDIYVGQVMDGERCGKGTYYFANGERYEGFFRNNNRHGVGTYFYTNGDFERGSFESGKKNGPFIYTFSNGKKENRVYLRDKLTVDSLYDRLKDWAEI